MKSIKFGLCLGLLLLAGMTSGQGTPLSFVNYGEEAGLRSNSVNDLAQDAAGFVWLCTSRGLHRFDGYRFKVYQHVVGDSTSLADSHTSTVFVDRQDRLWVGTNEGGVALFDRETETFRNYRNRTTGIVHLSHNQVTGIAQTPAGELWVATANGYNVWRADSENFTVHHAPPAHYLLPTDITHLTTILAPAAAPYSPATRQALSDGARPVTLQAITDWAGYEYYDERHAYEELARKVGPTVATDLWPLLEARLRREEGQGTVNSYNNITAIHADSLGNVFLGYRNGGVARLRSGEERPTLLWPNRNGRINHQLPAVVALQRVGNLLFQGLLHESIRITDLGDGLETIPDISGIPSSVYDIKKRGSLIYFGTPVGIIVYDLNRHEEWRYDNGENREWDVIANECPSLLVENDGSVWVGHNSHGVSHGTPPQAFTTEPDPAAGRLPFFLRSVSAVLEDSRGHLWLGYHEGGIRRLDAKSFSQEGIYLTASKPEVKRSSIFTVFEDSRGGIWAGSYESGLLRYDPARDDFFPSGVPFAKLGGGDIRDLVEDRDGYLWAAVHGFGLTRIDPTDGTTQPFPAFGDSPLSPYVFNMACDAQNRIWMVSVQGVYRMEADRKTVTAVITNEQAEPGRFSHRSFVLQIAENGTVWIGTEEGLLALDPEGKPVRGLNLPDALSGATIRGIELGTNGDLWVAARGQLYNYYPKTGQTFIYELPTYFGASQFFRGAHAALSDGRLAFGYNNGLISFRPGELHRPRFIPRPVVVNLEIFGNGAEQVNLRPDTNVASLRLPNANQGLAVDLSTLAYRNPDAVRYEVRLLPVQREWQEVEGELPRYTLYGLPPGEHTLEFRAAVTNGLGYSEVNRLRVSVPQPWYLSPWAFLGYFLSLLALFLGYRSYVKRRAELQQSVLIARLRAENTREVATAKASFFVNVSHELRTPLTLINGPLRELRKTPEPDAAKRQRFYGLMQRNTDRLRELVDRLLDLQKIESHAPELRFEEGDVVAFLQRLVEPFRPRAVAKDISFTTIFPELESLANFSSEVLERVCGNLLANALKYTPEGGKVDLRVLLLEEAGPPRLLIEVEDNGPGIPRDEIPHLFERFYRGEQSQQVVGSGVGLAIVKQYVELAGGKISCESDVGQGALFRCSLPIAPALMSHPVTPTTTPATLAEKPVKDKRPHLLVVDDDADIRELIRCGCEEDYRITEAADGKQALELARQVQPDLILTDLMMPEMDGVELCTLLKQDALTSHLPVLLLTARHSDAAREEALRAGANDYLTKPFDLDFLLQKVDNTLATLTAARKRWIAQPSELSEEVIAAADTDQQFLNTLRKYVEENMDAPDLDLNALLRELAVSRSVCYAKVKALTGLPLKAFIKYLRIGRARQLLELTDQPVGDIAYQTGFKTTQHFSRSFREIVGSSPTNFRESVRV